MAVGVQGTVAEGFEGVREEFAAFLAGEAHEPGAQLVAYHHGLARERPSGPVRPAGRRGPVTFF